MLPWDEYGPGMAIPVTFCAPIASTARTAVNEESMPPLNPISAFEKPHLRM